MRFVFNLLPPSRLAPALYRSATSHRPIRGAAPTHPGITFDGRDNSLFSDALANLPGVLSTPYQTPAAAADATVSTSCPWQHGTHTGKVLVGGIQPPGGIAHQF